MTKLPSLVALLTNKFDAWIVGSAANPSSDPLSCRDWDVIVPFEEWDRACSLIPKDATVNTFGGWKCTSEGKEVDVWPSSLNNLATHPMFTYAWHPKTGTYLKKIKSDLKKDNADKTLEQEASSFIETCSCQQCNSFYQK